MPCRDCYDDNPGAYYASTIADMKAQISFAESALCQTLEAFITEVGADKAFARINYGAAGISQVDLETWLNDHRIKDAEAKARIKAREEKEALRKEALSKLTYAERQALGI